MELEPGFFKTVWRLALPIALQSVLQASFSVVDQIMIGQLGSVQVAGVGLAGKFSSIFTVLVSAIAAVAGIMLAQYLGQRQTGAAARAFTVNLAVSAAVAFPFFGRCGVTKRFPLRTGKGICSRIIYVVPGTVSVF